ncbi:MAG: Crp/Fnr family transcriptional regulator [Minicystis sp.]
MHEPDPIDSDDDVAFGSSTRKPMNEGAKTRIQRALKLSQLFERATRATREGALSVAELEVVPGGTVIVRQGAIPDAFLVLGRGRVRIERDAGGGRVVPLGYRGSGEVLGEACLGHARAQAENATAMEETEIVKIPLAALDELLAADPSLSSALLGVLLARQRETEDRIESLLFRNVEGRVVEFILKAADRWGVPSPKGTLISAPITHLEIAQSIGSTRETVTLTLGALRREGLLDVAGRRLIVKNREGLSARQAL